MLEVKNLHATVEAAHDRENCDRRDADDNDDLGGNAVINPKQKFKAARRLLGAKSQRRGQTEYSSKDGDDIDHMAKPTPGSILQ